LPLTGAQEGASSSSRPSLSYPCEAVVLASLASKELTVAKHPRIRHGRGRSAAHAGEPPGLEHCLEGISYRAWWREGGCSSLANYFNHVRHHRAAETYARRYYAEHGRLPKGTHHVVLPPAFEADITFPVRLRRSSSPR
jgi:hypothetical protein